MKTFKAVLLFCAVAMVAAAQNFNTSAAAGVNNQTVLTVSGTSGKITVLDSICWGAQSGTSSTTIGSAVAINVLVGGVVVARFPTPHYVSTYYGQTVTETFCTPTNFKVYGMTGGDITIQFTIGVMGVIQNISTFGHLE